MNIWLILLLFIIGIIFIIKGGDYFVDASAWIAEVSGIPKLIIGATIVSIATTLPELMVSAFAALDGKVDMAIGNGVGSVTANIGMIMAISIICIPAVIRRNDYLIKSLLLILAAALIVVCGSMEQVTLPVAFCLLAIFIVFVVDNVNGAIRGMRESEASDEARIIPTRRDYLVNAVKFVVGVIGIIWGADLLVDNGSVLAAYVGISERIIGVTVIAVGTSLPELITTITAIIKKESSLSVGNILGACIIDLTLIMPVCSIIARQGLPIASGLAMIDLPACLLIAMVAIIPAMITERFRRSQGIIMLIMYGIYVYITCTI